MPVFRWEDLTQEQKAAAAAKAERLRLLGTEDAVPEYFKAVSAAVDTRQWQVAFGLLGELRSYVKRKQKEAENSDLR